MPTNDLRERLEKFLLDEIDLPIDDFLFLLPYIEQEVTRAREQMKQEVIDFLERQSRYPGGHSMGPRFDFCEQFITAISSLK